MSSNIRPEVEQLRARPRATVLIVGGGINGIALFRELAANGVDVALAEAEDFASGASASSSRMIHGGVRYLENGELRLVRESVQERNALLELARHRVHPLETTIPIFSLFSGIIAAPFRLLRHYGGKPVERGAVLIKLGLIIYDLFSREWFAPDRGRVPRHRFHGRKKSLRELPRLNPRLRYTATYHDASLPQPERLAIDLLLDGLDIGRDGGLAGDANSADATARAASYLAAVSVGPKGVRLRDHETGNEFDFAADLVVNTSGPWTDLTNRALGIPSELMGGTKGSHIVLDDPALVAAVAGREIFFENSDGRIVLIYPIRDRVLVGTTDIEADPAEPAVCTEAELDYFFDLIAYVFPNVPVGRDEIVFRYAGIRPLPNHGDLKPGFVSRDYRIVDTPLAGGSSGDGRLPAVSLVGGKWTTFRALGAQLADAVMLRLGVERIADLSRAEIGGAREFPDAAGTSAWIERYLASWPHERAEELLRRYGTRARAVAASEIVFGEKPLAGGLLSVGELRYLVDRERVRRVTDLVVRRTDFAFRGELTRPLIAELAAALGTVRGWSRARVADEVEETIALLNTRNGLSL